MRELFVVIVFGRFFFNDVYDLYEGYVMMLVEGEWDGDFEGVIIICFIGDVVDVYEGCDGVDGDGEVEDGVER